jgi:hypothetical protein
MLAPAPRPVADHPQAHPLAVQVIDFMLQVVRSSPIRSLTSSAGRFQFSDEKPNRVRYDDPRPAALAAAFALPGRRADGLPFAADRAPSPSGHCRP